MTDEPSAIIEPEYSKLLEAAKNSNLPELHMLTPAAARAQYAKGVSLTSGSSPEMAGVEDIQINGPEISLSARLYSPAGAPSDNAALLVYFHGGGWCFGSIETHDHVCRRLAVAINGRVLSVDYRLAPEHKFPAAVEDAIRAVRWASDNVHSLGVDPMKLYVGGDSAGGNLAAVAAINARDMDGPTIAAQLLIYPATDMAMNFPSHTTYGIGYRLTRPLMIWSVLNYLRDGRDLNDPRASPLRADNHGDLPPAIIITAGLDPLRDEGNAYANALREAGVNVIHKCYSGAIHGFVGLTGVSSTADDCISFIGNSLLRFADGKSGL